MHYAEIKEKPRARRYPGEVVQQDHFLGMTIERDKLPNGHRFCPDRIFGNNN